MELKDHRCSWWALLLLPALILTSSSAAAAQAPPANPMAAEEQRPLLERMGVRPTGRNGYEELCMAADALQRSKNFGPLTVSGGTLSAKRAVVQEKPVREALRLFRVALTKPIYSPRTELGAATLLPELSQFRSLARLLAMEHEVLMADGRVSDALANLRASLAFADAVQTDTLISGLVGIAIQAIVTQGTGVRLSQLSARDCELLYKISLEVLARPGSGERVVEQERRFAHTMLRDLQKAAREGDAGEVTRSLGIEDPRATAELKAALANPQEMERRTRAMHARIDAYYDGVRAAFRDPPWRRKFPEVTETGEDGVLLRLLSPAWQQAAAAYARGRAYAQLLAVHAVIRRYLWEHDRLPAGLEELQLGELAIDLFSGQPLRYERVDGGYRLWSVGSEAPPGDERAVEGRRPVSIIPGDF